MCNEMKDKAEVTVITWENIDQFVLDLSYDEQDREMKLANAKQFKFKIFRSVWKCTLRAALVMHAFKHARIRRQDTIRKLGPTKTKDSVLSDSELKAAQLEAQTAHLKEAYVDGVYEFFAEEANTIQAPQTLAELDATIAALMRQRERLAQ